MHFCYNGCAHPKEDPIKTDIDTTKQHATAINNAHKNITGISTAYSHQSHYSNRLDLYLDIVAIGFIDYKIKDELLKKIYINQISVNAYYQKRGLGTYLIECLKQEFDSIELFSVSTSLNIFYEKNHFVEDLLKIKQKNTTNYIWTKLI